jgi:HAD superfamily hydrolase (TIGR01484 family)
LLKLIIFDLDNTIAQPNRPVGDRVVRWMKKVEKRGVRVALASGKPVAYLAGLARQIGLKEPILSGENGAVVHYSANFPPGKILRPYANIATTNDMIESLRRTVVSRFGDRVWVQPNEINLTLFPYTRDTFQELKGLLDLEISQGGNGKWQIYRHFDSIEVTPSFINKGFALREIMRTEKLERMQVIAVGDGENDIPMFKEVGLSIGIRIDGGDHRFDSISQVMNFLNNVFENGLPGG